MGDVYTIQIPAIAANKALVLELMDIDGVRVEKGAMEVRPLSPYIDLYELAKLIGKSYHTVRRYVVDQGKIPFERSNGKLTGNIVIRREDAMAFFEPPKGGRKRPGRKSGEVKII